MFTNINEPANQELEKAIKVGDLEMVKYLVNKGASVNITDVNKDTPLHHAFRGLHLEVAQFLLQRGANIFLCNLKNERPLEAMLTPGKKCKLVKRMPMYKLAFHWGAGLGSFTQELVFKIFLEYQLGSKPKIIYFDNQVFQGQVEYISKDELHQLPKRIQRDPSIKNECSELIREVALINYANRANDMYFALDEVLNALEENTIKLEPETGKITITEKSTNDKNDSIQKPFEKTDKNMCTFLWCYKNILHNPARLELCKAIVAPAEERKTEQKKLN